MLRGLRGLTERFTRKNKNLNNTGIEMAGTRHAGLFVDNDKRKIDEVEKCKGAMETLHVKETPGYEPQKFVFTTQEEYITASNGFRNYIETYKDDNKLTEAGKAAADLFTRITLQNPRKVQKTWKGPIEYIYEENIDENSGITEDNVKFIKNWVTKNKGKHLFILFDYDRTLTKIEGGFFVGNSIQEMKDTIRGYGTEGLTAEGFIEYYAGGPGRVKMLQDMFDFLYDPQYHIDIYIVTNNPSCLVSRNRGLLDEVLRVLTKGRPLKYLCGVDYEGNKYKTILSDAVLTKEVCPRIYGGGKRKRKTRRLNKRK